MWTSVSVYVWTNCGVSIPVQTSVEYTTYMYDSLEITYKKLVGTRTKRKKLFHHEMSFRKFYWVSYIAAMGKAIRNHVFVSRYINRINIDNNEDKLLLFVGNTKQTYIICIWGHIWLVFIPLWIIRTPLPPFFLPYCYFLRFIFNENVSLSLSSHLTRCASDQPMATKEAQSW